MVKKKTKKLLRKNPLRILTAIILGLKQLEKK